MLERHEAGNRPQGTSDFARQDVALDLPSFHDDNDPFEGTYTSDEQIEPTTPWWRQRRNVIIAAVLLALILIGVIFAATRNTKAPTTYSTQTASTGNLALTVSGTGPVQADTYNVNFAVSGTVSQINVKVGDTVKSGQQLAKLDTSALQDAVNSAQISANQAYDQEQNSIYTCDTEKSPPPFCVQSAENQYASAVSQLTTAKHNLAEATLTAPHAGVVTSINGTVGGSSSGSSSSGGFIQVADPTALSVAASINEADIGGVAKDQLVTFTVSAYPGKTFRGTVAAVSQVGSTTSNVVTFPVTIAVDNTHLNGVSLYTGMTATVTITTAQRVNVTLLPATAVTFARAAANRNSGGFLTTQQVLSARTSAQQMLTTLEQQDATVAADSPTTAWVLERSNNQWVIKPVVLGLTNGTDYVVLAGLNAGETVVTGETNGTITTSASSSTGTGTGTRGAGGFGGAGGTGGFGGGFGGGAAGGR